MILLWSLDICDSLKVSKNSKDLHVHFCSLSLPNLAENTKTQEKRRTEQFYVENTKTQGQRRHKTILYKKHNTQIANRHTPKHYWLRTQKHKDIGDTEHFCTENTTHTADKHIPKDYQLRTHKHNDLEDTEHFCNKLKARQSCQTTLVLLDRQGCYTHIVKMCVFILILYNKKKALRYVMFMALWPLFQTVCLFRTLG